MQTVIKHEFRANLMSDWEKVMFEDDVITYQKGEAPGLNIPVSAIQSVRIVSNYGGSFSCHIVYGDGDVLKVNSGAIEKFGSPYQNLESFALFSHALLVRPNPSFRIDVGSNTMFYFSLGSLIVGGLVVLGVMLVAMIKGGMPAYIEWKMGILLTMLILFSWPLFKLGKSNQVQSLESLPYELPIFVMLANKEGVDAL